MKKLFALTHTDAYGSVKKIGEDFPARGKAIMYASEGYIPTLTPEVVLNDCWQVEGRRARLSLGLTHGFLTVIPSDAIGDLPED